MYSVILQPPSRNRCLLRDKFPIMHIIGNCSDGVVWSGFPACSRPNERAGRCVNSDTVTCSCEVQRSSQGFTTVLKCSVENDRRKKEISKLKGVFIYGYENLNFPTKRYFKSTASLTHLPFRYLRYACKSEWFLNTHAPRLFGRCVGFGFSEAVGWQRYAEGSGVR